METIRVGLVGFGAMGRNHFRTLKTLESVNLVGVLDVPGNEALERTGERYFTDFESFIEAKPEAVIVATPTHSHSELAKKFAAADVHTLLEKPIAPSLEQATEIANAFKQKGLVGAVGHIERFNPAMQNLKTRASEGDIGEIIQITSSRQGPYPARIADVGVCLDLASHDIDSTMWVSQSKYKTIASSMRKLSNTGFEDLLVSVGELENGVIFNHIVNWASPFKERQFRVLGTRGSLIADTLTGDLHLHKNGEARTENQWDLLANFRGISEGDLIRFAYPKIEPLRTEILGFLEAVRSGDASNIVSMQEALEVIKVTSRILEP